ncbi:MAG: hypothetical protein ACTSXC_04835 [Candidatus Freyarchaeota archaeon]
MGFPVPKLVSELDYKIKTLEWSRYELKDGDIVKVINIPVKIFLTDQKSYEDLPVYGIFWHHIISVITPQEKRGKPSKEIPLKKLEKLPHKDVEWKILEEPFSEFELIGEPIIIKAKTVVTRIQVVEGVFDKWGNKMLKVTHDVISHPEKG